MIERLYNEVWTYYDMYSCLQEQLKPLNIPSIYTGEGGGTPLDLYQNGGGVHPLIYTRMEGGYTPWFIPEGGEGRVPFSDTEGKGNAR